MRRLTASILVLSLVSAIDGPARAESDDDLWAGKARTARDIELSAVIDGHPAGLFEMWTTEGGVDRFFGVDSKIEPRVGGLYEIGFGLRPDGQRAGTRDTRILRFEPGRALDFEWEMPAFASELNARPLPTWVEVRFESVAEHPPKTLVSLAHHGFGENEAWQRSHRFFLRNWFEVLFRLKLLCGHFESRACAEALAAVEE